MVWLDKSQKGTLLQWHSSHNLLGNASLEAFRQNAPHCRFEVEVRPIKTVEYRDVEQIVAPNVFYIPESANEVALDSFIIMDGILYIFQFTIASSHDIKPGLANIFKMFQDLPTMDNWHFIFIHPPNQLLKVPQPYLVKLRQLEPYSAVISL